MYKWDSPHVDRCTGHGKEPLSPLLWSPHLCASGWLLTQRTYLFVCLSDERKIYIHASLAGRNMLYLQRNKDFNYLFLVQFPLNLPRLYHTSISPLRVRTSMMVWPRKSSLSRLNLCFTRDLMSSSSSQTRTLMRSDELWHSLNGTETQIVKEKTLWCWRLWVDTKMFSRRANEVFVEGLES